MYGVRAKSVCGARLRLCKFGRCAAAVTGAQGGTAAPTADCGREVACQLSLVVCGARRVDLWSWREAVLKVGDVAGCRR